MDPGDLPPVHGDPGELFDQNTESNYLDIGLVKDINVPIVDPFDPVGRGNYLADPPPTLWDPGVMPAVGYG